MYLKCVLHFVGNIWEKRYCFYTGFSFKRDTIETKTYYKKKPAKKNCRFYLQTEIILSPISV
jgi:hypothetical protein